LVGLGHRCPLHTVVPDKRATSARDPGPINHRIELSEDAGATARSNDTHLWLWVPAFAGTTST
jgi:hypothetical protein